MRRISYGSSWLRLRRIRRIGLTALVVCAGEGLVSCSDQSSTGPRHGALAGRAAIALTLSDSTAAVGSLVSISIDVQQPDTMPSSAIAAFRARLSFDPTALQYVDATSEGSGVTAVNVVSDTARMAGAAPGTGFAGGRLATLNFRVLDPQGLRSVHVIVDELHDLAYKDRRPAFVAHSTSNLQIRGDITAQASSSRVYGDATADGTIDAADVLAILTKDVGLTPPVGFDSLAADVNIDGVVSALDAQIVLASLVGRSVSEFRLGDVVGSALVTITGVAPDTLLPGTTATITGSNFSTVATNDTVMIDTVPAVVTAATATQLTVTVPQTISCRAAHPAVVSVRFAGATGQYRQMLRVATMRSMQVGDTLVLDSDAAFRCNEFSAGTYFAAVYDAAREAAVFPDTFQLVSTAAMGLDNQSPVNNRIPLRIAQNRIPRQLGWRAFPGTEQMRQRAIAHLQFMERDRQRFAGVNFAAVRQNVIGQSTLLRRSLNMVQTVGAYSTFNFRAVSQAGLDSVITIRARTVYVGTHSIIVEDSAAPLAGQVDSYYQELGPEFDNVMYPILLANFGNPMAMDSRLSGVGRVIMLFTPNVTKYYPNVEAFVTTCDFLTPANCSGTNQTEIFYGDVPTRATTSNGGDPRYDGSTPAGWYNDMRGTLIHESKHITAFGEKISRSSQPLYEESWLEEGTAQIASELYARGVSGTTWKGGVTYAQAMQCEITLCPGYSFTMYQHFAWLYDYETEDNLLSPINAGSVDATIYGSAWLFARWAADIYASTEPTFFKALIQQNTVNGVSNLEARTGQPWSKLLGQWALALAADHYGLSTPTPGIPSWNTRDMFAGLYQSQGQSFLTPYPLYMPTYTSAPLSIPGTVAAGSAAFYNLQFGVRQSIGIRQTATTDLPHTTNLRLAVIRMQ